MSPAKCIHKHYDFLFGLLQPVSYKVLINVLCSGLNALFHISNYCELKWVYNGRSGRIKLHNIFHTRCFILHFPPSSVPLPKTEIAFCGGGDTVAQSYFESINSFADRGNSEKSISWTHSRPGISAEVYAKNKEDFPFSFFPLYRWDQSPAVYHASSGGLRVSWTLVHPVVIVCHMWCCISVPGNRSLVTIRDSGPPSNSVHCLLNFM